MRPHNFQDMINESFGRTFKCWIICFVVKPILWLRNRRGVMGEGKQHLNFIWLIQYTRDIPIERTTILIDILCIYLSAIHIHHYKYVCTQSLTVHCALSEWVRVHGPWRVCDVSEINSILSNQLTYYLTDCLIRWERLYCHKDTRSVLGVGYPVSVV